jgi:uncharacterized protein (TIGR02246 family)
MMQQTSVEDDIRALYMSILAAWNARGARDFAAQFTPDGHTVGFDGTQADSAAEIEAHLSQVFSSHMTATYVAKVREVRPLCDGAVMLRAVVGMVPPGGSDINPATNAIQTLVAVYTENSWRAVMLHTTPAAFHGRPDAVEALTNELRGLR